MSPFLILLIPIITAATAQILFKKGILAIGELEFSLSGVLNLIPKILQNAWLLSGMIIFGISFLVYLFVLSKSQLNIAYPIVVSAGIIIIFIVLIHIDKNVSCSAPKLGILILTAPDFALTLRAEGIEPSTSVLPACQSRPEIFGNGHGRDRTSGLILIRNAFYH